jgi:hypothetical protein
MSHGVYLVPHCLMLQFVNAFVSCTHPLLSIVDLQLSQWFTDMSLKSNFPSNQPFPIECF